MAVDPAQSVGQLVVERPGRSRVFESLGIDYCCGGKRTLADACRRKGLEVAAVVEQLAASDRQSDSAGKAEEDPAGMTLSALADHVERRHHDYLRAALPRIEQLTARVAAVHGERDPRLVRVHQVSNAFRDEIVQHMFKEEQVLFPMIRALETGTAAAGSFHCGSIENPIRQMEHEHDQSGAWLSEMRALTDDFTPSETACNTHRAMLDALAELERDMHQHVHKENNILFPRAIELEQAAVGGSA